MPLNAALRSPKIDCCTKRFWDTATTATSPKSGRETKKIFGARKIGKCRRRRVFDWCALAPHVPFAHIIRCAAAAGSTVLAWETFKIDAKNIWSCYASQTSISINRKLNSNLVSRSSRCKWTIEVSSVVCACAVCVRLHLCLFSRMVDCLLFSSPPPPPPSPLPWSSFSAREHPIGHLLDLNSSGIDRVVDMTIWERSTPVSGLGLGTRTHFR